MSAGIIMDGRRFGCRAPVLTWEETGLRFEVGRGARRRTREIDLFVWHWTGAENEPPIMFRTLEKRELGIEFAIGGVETTPGFATIYQFADPILIDTFDAGTVNRRSLGCEIVNYGSTRLSSLGRVPPRGADRERYDCELHGRRRKLAAFRPFQIASAFALLESVLESGTTGISRDVATVPRVLTPGELRVATGSVGHYHLSRKKADPGLDLLSALDEGLRAA